MADTFVKIFNIISNIVEIYNRLETRLESGDVKMNNTGLIFAELRHFSWYPKYL